MLPQRPTTLVSHQLRWIPLKVTISAPLTLLVLGITVRSIDCLTFLHVNAVLIVAVLAIGLTLLCIAELCAQIERMARELHMHIMRSQM